MAYSNVRPVDPVTGRPTRVTFRYTEEGAKVGLCLSQLARACVVQVLFAALQQATVV